jgi:hypothetical protein
VANFALAKPSTNLFNKAKFFTHIFIFSDKVILFDLNLASHIEVICFPRRIFEILKFKSKTLIYITGDRHERLLGGACLSSSPHHPHSGKKYPDRLR